MMSRTLAILGAASLAWSAPALAQQSSTPSSSGQQQTPSGGQPQSPSGGQQEISQEDMQDYVDALVIMVQFEPAIGEALQQGEPVDSQVLDKVPQADAKKAMDQAGLSQDEFRRITQKLNEDPSAKQQYKQVAQQASHKAGSMSGTSSGSTPAGSASPSTGSSSQSPSGAQPSASPQ